jgi:hypothetical protein
MRQAVAVLAGAVVAALGALILGEYELKGVMALVAGALFGVAVAEVVVAVARHPGLRLGLAAGVLAAAGMVWAAWIAAGRVWSYVGSARWVAVGVSVVAAPVWIRTSGRREPDTPPDP